MDKKLLLPACRDEASLKLHDDIAQMLMDFVCHGHKPFSKSLQKFLVRGTHDLRAGLVSVAIIARVQQYLDETKNE